VYQSKRSSGVTHYEIFEDYIDLRFRGKEHAYRYHISRISKYHIDIMKELAVKGEKLSTYINQHPEVKNNAIIINV
jgi:hypothetical protein